MKIWIHCGNLLSVVFLVQQITLEKTIIYFTPPQLSFYLEFLQFLMRFRARARACACMLEKRKYFFQEIKVRLQETCASFSWIELRHLFVTWPDLWNLPLPPHRAIRGWPSRVTSEEVPPDPKWIRECHSSQKEEDKLVGIFRVKNGLWLSAIRYF